MAKLLKSIKEKYLFLGIAFLLCFIPIYPKFPLLGVSGTYVNIRLEDIFVALVVGLFFAQLIFKKDYSLLKDNLTKLFGLFFAIGLASILSAVLITKNILPHLALLHFLRRVEYISLFFVAYASLKNLKQLKTYGWIILVSTLLVIAYGLGQKYFGWPVVSTMNKEFSRGMILKLTWWARINSTFAGHYDLAAYMVMIMPLSMGALMIVKKKLAKIPIIILTILSYYVLLLTASRVSFIAYLVGVSFLLFFSKKKLWLIPFLIFSLMGMIFSDDLGQRYAATFKIDLSFLSGKVFFKTEEIAVIPTPTPVPVAVISTITVTPLPQITITTIPTPIPTATASSEPIETTALATSRSTDIRLKVEWPRAIRALAKNPLLGTGYSSITLATDNDYLRMLGETGLLGASAFFLIILEIFRKFYFFLKKTANREKKLILLSISGAAIGYFLNAVFIDVLEASKIAFFFWIMMGIGVKIIDLDKAESVENKK